MKTTRNGQMRLTHEKATMEKLHAYMEQDTELKAFLTKPLEEMPGGYRSVVAIAPYNRFSYLDKTKTLVDIIGETIGGAVWSDSASYSEFLIVDRKVVGYFEYQAMKATGFLQGRYPRRWYIHDTELLSCTEDMDWNSLRGEMIRIIHRLRRKHFAMVCNVVVESSAENMLSDVLVKHFHGKRYDNDMKNALSYTCIVSGATILRFAIWIFDMPYYLPAMIDFLWESARSGFKWVMSKIKSLVVH